MILVKYLKLHCHDTILLIFFNKIVSI